MVQIIKLQLIFVIGDDDDDDNRVDVEFQEVVDSNMRGEKIM